MKTKRFASFLAVSLCGLLAAGAGFQSIAANRELQVSEDVSIRFKGEAFTPRDANGRAMPVFAYDGSVYAPVRAVAEAAGLEVGYDPASRTVSVADPSPVPEEPGQWQQLEFFQKVGAIQVRDGQGRMAVISGSEALDRWLPRLDGEYRKGGSAEGYKGTGIDLIFFDADGNYLDKFTDITEEFVTYQDEAWTFAGANLDLGRLELLLAGEPDESGPEKLCDEQQAAWAIAYGGDAYSGKQVAIKDGNLEKLQELLAPLTFQKGEVPPQAVGCPIGISLYDADGRLLGGFAPAGKEQVHSGGYEYQVLGGEIDWDWIGQLLEELPEAEVWEVEPVVTLDGFSQADQVILYNKTFTERTVITDTELLKKLADNLGRLEFRRSDRLLPEDVPEAANGLPIVLTRDGELVEFGLRVLDEKTIRYGGGVGYLCTVLEGEIDKELLDQLADPAGPYSSLEGVVHEAAGRDENGGPVWPVREDK